MPLLTTEERIGQVVAGKYRIDRVLGEGGMGVVYAGHHLRLDLPIAVKFLHASHGRSEGAVARFVREARAMSRLVHPNVVTVRDVDVHDADGSPFMVLELLRGEPLSALLARERALGLRATLEIIGPLCKALSAAHAMGIVHRDVKPDNVFLTRSEEGDLVPKLLDFGIARVADAGDGAAPTVTGAVMGTVLYMAPEQMLGRTREIGPWSDVWSTAVVAYECLTGRRPFDADVEPGMTPMQAMWAVMNARLVPLREHRPELAEVGEVLSRALARASSERIRSTQELAAELERVSARLPAAVRERSGELSSGRAAVSTGELDAAPPVAALGSSLSDRHKDSLAETLAPPASSQLSALDISVSGSAFLPPTTTAATETGRGGRSRRWLLVAGAVLIAVGSLVAALVLTTPSDDVQSAPGPERLTRDLSEPVLAPGGSPPPTALVVSPPQERPDDAQEASGDATPAQAIDREGGPRPAARAGARRRPDPASAATTSTEPATPSATPITTETTPTLEAPRMSTEHRSGGLSGSDFE